MEANDDDEFVFEIFDGGKFVGTRTFWATETEEMNRVIVELYSDGFSVRPKEGP